MADIMIFVHNFRRQPIPCERKKAGTGPVATAPFRLALNSTVTASRRRSESGRCGRAAPALACLTRTPRADSIWNLGSVLYNTLGVLYHTLAIYHPRSVI